MFDKNIVLDNRGFLLGEFDDDHKLIHAVETLRSKGVKITDCYTPFPVHGLDHAMGVKRTNLTVAAFILGSLGALSGFTLAYYMNVADWPMNIGGKPDSIGVVTSFIPIIFELTILFSAFGMGFLFFGRSRMFPGVKEDIFTNRQTSDRMLIAVDNEDIDSRSALTKMFVDNGAINVMEHGFGEYDALESTSFVAEKVVEEEVVIEEKIVEEVAPVVEAATEKVELNEEEKQSKIDLLKATLGTATESDKDDLKRIKGIGPVYEKTLNSIGIYTFEQVSKMDANAIKAVEELTNYFPGRIERDNWIEQAKTFKEEK